MISLHQIERAIPALTEEEVRQLEMFLHKFVSERSRRSHAFTGADGICWWNESHHLGSEAEAFSADLDAARAEIGLPLSQWD